MKLPRTSASPSADDADRNLFREAIGPVRELAGMTDPRRASRPAPAPQALQSQADERRVLDELLATADEALTAIASGEVLAHLQDGYPPRLLRQLRRGQFVVEAELDLHHLRLAAGRALLGQFLAECRQRRQRCVRIVHGKARAAQEGSVLKAMVDRVLRQRAEVIGFVSARPQDGGTGAVVALLKA